MEKIEKLKQIEYRIENLNKEIADFEHEKTLVERAISRRRCCLVQYEKDKKNISKRLKKENKTFEDYEKSKNASRKWLVVIQKDPEIDKFEYLEHFKIMFEQKNVRKIYFAFDELSEHFHCYFDFLEPVDVDYFKSCPFDGLFEKFNGSCCNAYSYIEDHIIKGTIYSIFDSERVVEKDVDNTKKEEALSEVSESEEDYFSVIIKDADSEKEGWSYSMLSDGQKELLVDVCNDFNLEFTVYQKIKE